MDMTYPHEMAARLHGVIPPCVIAAAGNCIWRERGKKEIKKREELREGRNGADKLSALFHT